MIFLSMRLFLSVGRTIMNISKRNTALDIVRIVAFFSVVAIHFWLYTGYYEVKMAGVPMLIFTVLRCAVSYCVPLFIMLSGYLLNQKKLSKRYYLGIIKILGTYVLSAILCMIFKHLYFGDELTFPLTFFSILDYKGANYAWYIEMYIGLFLLIPFLNTMYHGLEGKGQKKTLIWTLIGLSALPTIANIYNFIEPGWFMTPTISDSYQKLIPDWWMMIYPVTYYMIGAYLREYPIKMKKRYNLLLFVVAACLFGLFNYYRDYGRNYSWGLYTDWNSVQALVLAVLVFLFFSQRNLTKCPTPVKKILAHLSDLCLGAYLMSYVADCSLYPFLYKVASTLNHRALYFIPMVLLVGCVSLLLSQLLNLLYKALEWLITTIFKQKKKPTDTKELVETKG